MLHRPMSQVPEHPEPLAEPRGNSRGRSANGSRDPSEDGDRSSSGCSTSSSWWRLATADDPGRYRRAQRVRYRALWRTQSGAPCLRS